MQQLVTHGKRRNNMTDDKELFEITAPSGDVYSFRLMMYGEKMNVLIDKAKGTKITASQKGFRDGKKFSPDADIEIDATSTMVVQREIVWRTLVTAPWLKEGVKCTQDMVDKNIKGIDAENVNAFVEKINFPVEEIVEKSNGQ